MKRRWTPVALLAAGSLAAAMSGAVPAHAATVKAHTATRTYTIAYEGPLSGGNAQLGLNMKYAVELAINQANAGATFGKLPFKLKYTEQDDQGSGTQSPTSAQALINNPNVVGVVGPAFSGATKAAEPFFHEANLATVSPSATAPDLATQGWTNFFRVVADDNAQGPADALFIIKKLGDKKIYAVDDASAYASGLVTAFDGAAKSDGATVIHETAPGTTQCQAGTGNVQQYGALAQKIKAAKPTAVFYAGYYCDFALMAKAVRAAGYKGQLASDDGSLDPHYIAQAGAAVANGTVVSCACGDISKTPAGAKFAAQFKKLAGFAVGTYSAESYDATNTIIDVMKSLGANIGRNGVVKGLHKVTYVGLTKTVKFQPNGNISGTAVYENQVEHGQFVQLGLVSQLVS